MSVFSVSHSMATDSSTERKLVTFITSVRFAGASVWFSWSTFIFHFMLQEQLVHRVLRDVLHHIKDETQACFTFQAVGVAASAGDLELQPLLQSTQMHLLPLRFVCHALQD